MTPVLTSRTTPAIDIEKSTNGEDADTPTGPIIFVGDTVTWEYFVENTGNVPFQLSEVTVTDDQGVLPVFDPTSDVGGDEILSVDETWRYFAEGIAQEGQYANLGTVVATFDPTDQTVTDNDPSHYLGQVPFEAPGVRTPGFWGNNKWQKFWDGIQGNEPSQASQPNFPDSDLFHPPYTNSEVPGEVLDPVTGTYETGVLIGDYDRNGMTSEGENTIFYTTEQALQIINASNKVQQDKRYTLGRSLVASWLNYLAGNPIDTADPSDMDTRYYIDEATDWLQALTPDENGDLKGDGALDDLVGSTVNSPAIPASSEFWNLGVADAESLPNPYDLNTAVNYPVDAGNTINGALDDYNNFGTGADGAFPG